jgi:guanylate kinase
MATPTDRRPIVICGPSGVGKGTLYKLLFDRHPDTFTLSVSHTTRHPRPGEQDGVDYHYVSMDDFESLIAAQGFVEHAKFGSNRYGTSKKTIEEQSAKGKVVVLDIEIDGVRQVRASDFGARYVFIMPPSVEELETRLRGRGTEKEESIRQRLDRAKEEIEFANQGGFDKVIVNDNLESAYKELDDWVYGVST